MRKRQKKNSNIGGRAPNIVGGRAPYYPVFLDLRGRDCLVIGGGRVAERKALALLRAGARVKVISPSLTPRLGKESAKGGLRHIARRYRKGDLRGAFLAIAAVDSAEENRKVAEDAEGVLLNVVDTPSLCSFIVPSTVKRGPLQIAISTSGASPAMAKAIRKELEALYTARLGRYLSALGEKRREVILGVADAGKRRKLLKPLASADVLKRLR